MLLREQEEATAQGLTQNSQTRAFRRAARAFPKGPAAALQVTAPAPDWGGGPVSWQRGPASSLSWQLVREWRARVPITERRWRPLGEGRLVAVGCVWGPAPTSRSPPTAGLLRAAPRGLVPDVRPVGPECPAGALSPRRVPGSVGSPPGPAPARPLGFREPPGLLGPSAARPQCPRRSRPARGAVRPAACQAPWRCAADLGSPAALHPARGGLPGWNPRSTPQAPAWARSAASQPERFRATRAQTRPSLGGLAAGVEAPTRPRAALGR